MYGRRPKRTKRQVYAARVRMINVELKEVVGGVFGPSTVPAPAPYAAGPSMVPAPVAYAESTVETHEEEGETTSSSDEGKESLKESENECELSSCDSKGDFDADDAQNCFDDSMISIPSLTRKTFSITLMHYFQQCQGICKTECTRGGLHYWL